MASRIFCCGALALLCAVALGATTAAHTAETSSVIRSWSGHAPVSGGVAMLVTDWVHVLSTGVWAGVVFAAAWVVLRRRPLSSPADREDCQAFVGAVSTTATVALALVLATGAVNAWRGLVAGSNSGLLGSEWTVILLVKLALAVLAAALGGHNRRSGLPNLTAALAATASPKAVSCRRFPP